MPTPSVRRVSRPWSRFLAYYQNFDTYSWECQVNLGGRIVPSKRAVGRMLLTSGQFFLWIQSLLGFEMKKLKPWRPMRWRRKAKKNFWRKFRKQQMKWRWHWLDQVNSIPQPWEPVTPPWHSQAGPMDGWLHARDAVVALGEKWRWGHVRKEEFSARRRNSCWTNSKEDEGWWTFIVCHVISWERESTWWTKMGENHHSRRKNSATWWDGRREEIRALGVDEGEEKMFESGEIPEELWSDEPAKSQCQGPRRKTDARRRQPRQLLRQSLL